jgi:hypothetical protein
VTEAAQGRAHEGGFTGTEVADKLHLQPVECIAAMSAWSSLQRFAHAFDCLRKALAEGMRSGFVRERERAFEQKRGGRLDRVIGIGRHSRKMA